MAANEKIRNRGRTGAAFAAELAKEYVAEGTKIAAIVGEVSSGKMQQRVDAIIAREKVTSPAQDQTAAPATETSYVNRLTQPKQPPLQVALEPEVGAFTKKLNQQALANMVPGSPSIN